MGSWVRQIKLVHIFQIVYRSWNPAIPGWNELTADLCSIRQIFQPKEKSKQLLYDILKKITRCWDIKTSPTSLKRIKKRKIKIESKNCKAFMGNRITIFGDSKRWGFLICQAQMGILCIHLQWYCLSLLSQPAKSSRNTAWECVPWEENLEKFCWEISKLEYLECVTWTSTQCMGGEEEEDAGKGWGML